MRNAPMKWWNVVTLSFIVTVLGIIPGLGLPGGTMLMIGGIVLGPLGYFFLPAWNPETWPSDAAWPAAILLTFTLFPFLIIAHAVELRYVRKLPSWKRSVAWFGMYVAWSVIGYAAIAAMIAYGM